MIRLVFASVLLAACSSDGLIQDAAHGPGEDSSELTGGYVLEEGQRTFVVASWDEGVDDRFDPAQGHWASRSWTTPRAIYSEAVPLPAEDFSRIAAVGATSLDLLDQDGANYWDAITAFGWADVEYQLNLPVQPECADYGECPNLLDTRPFARFELEWYGWSSARDRVSLSLYARSSPGTWQQLAFLEAGNNEYQTSTIPLAAIPDAERAAVSRLLFRVSSPADGQIDPTAFQRTALVDLRMIEDAPPSIVRDGAGVHVESRYLGRPVHRRGGTYSASGFWDPALGRFRLWFGSGIPESGSSDNIYYAEVDRLQGDWTHIQRIGAELDHGGELKAWNSSPGYGGDPSVIQLGPDRYVMYFSGIRHDWTGALLGEGFADSQNRIYRAVSSDAIHWTTEPRAPVVDARTAPRFGGYGSGAPSAVLRDGVYYLYYYSQTEDFGYEQSIGWSYLRTSTDGVSFGPPTPLNGDFGAPDVKWLPELGKWMAISARQLCPAIHEADLNAFFQSGHPCVAQESYGVYVAFSEDGVHFDPEPGQAIWIDQPRIEGWFHPPGTDLYQKGQAHNAALIGDPLGHAGLDLYAIYGVNELPFPEAGYASRGLELSSIHVRP